MSKETRGRDEEEERGRNDGCSPPLFITFEGVEGAGKTTQILLLRDALEALGTQVFVTREPGGEPVAEAIRSVLLSAAHPVMPSAELLLFMAARAQMVARVLQPQLDAGKCILCDRYTDSSIAYQGYARGQDLEIIRSLNTFATGGLKPDLTLLLDLDPSSGLARQTERNRMEAESLDFHYRVREGYLSESRREPSRFRVIDAARTVDAVHLDILTAVHDALNSRKDATPQRR